MPLTYKSVPKFCGVFPAWFQFEKFGRDLDKDKVTTNVFLKQITVRKRDKNRLFKDFRNIKKQCIF